jgi:hypothetical protein
MRTLSGDRGVLLEEYGGLGEEGRGYAGWMVAISEPICLGRMSAWLTRC